MFFPQTSSQKKQISIYKQAHPSTHPLKSPHLSPTKPQPSNYSTSPSPPLTKKFIPTGWCSIPTYFPICSFTSWQKWEFPFLICSSLSTAKHLFSLIQRCKEDLFGRQSFISKRRFQGAQVVGSNGHLGFNFNVFDMENQRLKSAKCAKWDGFYVGSKEGIRKRLDCLIIKIVVYSS